MPKGVYERPVRVATCHPDQRHFAKDMCRNLNGDGKAHRLQFGERGNSDGVVRDLKRRGWPKDGYTILCFNCNMGKAVNGGICPHQVTFLRLITLAERP